jgi:hypothetical protein
MGEEWKQAWQPLIDATSSPVATLGGDSMQKLMPRTTGFFATDIEIDYLQNESGGHPNLIRQSPKHHSAVT